MLQCIVHQSSDREELGEATFTLEVEIPTEMDLPLGNLGLDELPVFKVN